MSGEAKTDGSHEAKGVGVHGAMGIQPAREQDYSERVRSILLSQPLNPLVKLKFSVMPRTAN